MNEEFNESLDASLAALKTIYVNIYDIFRALDTLSEKERNGSKLRAYRKVKRSLLSCEAVQLDNEKKTVVRTSWEKQKDDCDFMPEPVEEEEK